MTLGEVSLARFRNRSVTILGDLILDEFITCVRERTSSEHCWDHGPGWNVQEVGVERYPGGAGNVAHNVKALGGTPQLISVVGIGGTAEDIQGTLEDLGIATQFLINDRDRRTSIKRRFVDPTGAYLMDIFNRDTVDSTTGRHVPVSEAIVLRALEHLRETRGGTVVITDNHRGFCTRTLLGDIREFCLAEGRRLVCDVRPRLDCDLSVLEGAFLVKTNRREAAQLLGRDEPIVNGEDSLLACRELAQRFHSNILLTLDKEGMMLFPRESGGAIAYPASARDEKVRCVSGAGDTVVATVGLALEAGFDLTDAVEIASHAAAIVVRKPHTAVVTHQELADAWLERAVT